MIHKFPIIVIRNLRVQGMAIFPFIIIRNPEDRQNSVLIRHETIHLLQQIELLILPFYIGYFANYIYNLIIYGKHNQAYKEIVFEREAFSKETDPHYLANRKLWSFIRYAYINNQA